MQLINSKLTESYNNWKNWCCYFKMIPRGRGNKFTINIHLLCAQALKFAVMLLKETFKASNYWLMHFRYQGIIFQEIHRKKMSAQINEANERQQNKMLQKTFIMQMKLGCLFNSYMIEHWHSKMNSIIAGRNRNRDWLFFPVQITHAHIKSNISLSVIHWSQGTLRMWKDFLRNIKVIKTLGWIIFFSEWLQKLKKRKRERKISFCL